MQLFHVWEKNKKPNFLVFVSKIKTNFFVHHMFTQFWGLPLGAAGPREWAGRKAGLQVDGNAGGAGGYACASKCVWGWLSQHRNLKT